MAFAARFDVDARIHDVVLAAQGIDEELLTRCVANQDSAPDVKADAKLGNLVSVEAAR